MSPPIYTPDGSEVSEIVLPDGSTASEVIGPDGNVVFEAGPDIPDSVLLPESDDLTHFSGDTADYDINSNAPKFNTEYTDLSLKTTNPSSGNESIFSTSGLSFYPQVGQPHRFAVYLDSTNSISQIGFNNDSESSRNNGYSVAFLEPNGGFDQVEVRRWDGGSVTRLATKSAFGLSAGEWHEAEVLHESDGSLTVTIFDNTGTQLTQFSLSDSTHLSSGSYDNQGVFIINGRPEADAYDFWRFV